VFLARLGLGIGAAAAGLAAYFWVAGDDPHKYENYRDVAAPAAAPAGKSAERGGGVPSGYSLSWAAVPAEGGGQLMLAGRF
jgi:hypothetical protein